MRYTGTHAYLRIPVNQVKVRQLARFPESWKSHTFSASSVLWQVHRHTRIRCRANPAHIRQSRPDSGLGGLGHPSAEDLKTFQHVFSRLGSGLRMPGNEIRGQRATRLCAVIRLNAGAPLQNVLVYAADLDSTKSVNTVLLGGRRSFRFPRTLGVT